MKRRDITKDASLVERAVVAAFSAHGIPSYRSAREVADRLCLTPQSVTALLHAAWERGLFSIHLNLEAERAEQLELEEAVRVRYALDGVLLVPTSADIEELGPRQDRSVREQMVHAMAERVTEHLDAVVRDTIGRRRDASQAGRELAPLLLGVGRGPHMRPVADHVRCSRRRPRLAAFEVWPIVGMTGALNSRGDDASPIATDIARAYGGVPGQLPCPAFVPPPEAALVVQPRPVRQVIQRIRSCDAVIAGLGALPQSPEETDATLASDAALNAELLRIARHAGAVGHVSSFLFDAEGRPPTMPYATIGIGLDGLRQMVKDGRRQVVLVAGGDERALAPLEVALRTGLASVLVSEAATARRLTGHQAAGGDLPHPPSRGTP